MTGGWRRHPSCGELGGLFKRSLQVLCCEARFATCRCYPRLLCCCGTAVRPSPLCLAGAAGGCLLIAGFMGGACFVRPRRLLLLSCCVWGCLPGEWQLFPCIIASGLPDLGPMFHRCILPLPYRRLWLPLPCPLCVVACGLPLVPFPSRSEQVFYVHPLRRGQ